MADFRDTFVSPFVRKTEEEARRELDQIRLNFPASSGWEEVYGYIEQHGKGWRAVRVHLKREVTRTATRF